MFGISGWEILFLQDEVFQRKISEWLSGNVAWYMRIYDAIKGIYNNKIPREFRILGIGHWISKTFLASSAPCVAYYFYASISGWTAMVASAAIFIGHSIVGMLDRGSKEKKKGMPVGDSEILIRFGDLLAALRANSTAAPNKDDAIRACLGILEIFARQITKSNKGDVSVSLVQYIGNSRSKMRIKYRNPGNERPVNREFDCRHLAGHYACQAGIAPRVVNDIRQFGRAGRTSPTQSTVNYRSIFIIPIAPRKADGNHVSGFVSIDCSRPYAFYGNRDNIITVTCEPVISHIRDLI